jgi:Cu/Ag efflux pump CusA
VVIVAGTLSACALTLLLLPVMYRIWERLMERTRPRTSHGAAEPVAGPI